MYCKLATLRNMELRIEGNSSLQTLMGGKSRRVMTSLLKSAMNCCWAPSRYTRPVRNTPLLERRRREEREGERGGRSRGHRACGDTFSSREQAEANNNASSRRPVEDTFYLLPFSGRLLGFRKDLSERRSKFPFSIPPSAFKHQIKQPSHFGNETASLTRCLCVRFVRFRLRILPAKKNGKGSERFCTVCLFMVTGEFASLPSSFPPSPICYTGSSITPPQ